MTEFIAQHKIEQMVGETGSGDVDPMQAAVRELSALGMSVLDVALWLTRGADDLDTAIARARVWHQVRFSYHEAKPWLEVGGWSAQEAGEWAAWGYEARQANFISVLIRRDMIDEGDFRPPRFAERRWMRSGLAPEWVCICVAAGVKTPEDAARLYQRNLEDPHTKGDLHLQGVVYRGADGVALTYDGMDAEPES